MFQSILEFIQLIEIEVSDQTLFRYEANESSRKSYLNNKNKK